MNSDYLNKTYEIEKIESNINEDKSEISKRTAQLAATAFAIGIGALGMYRFGNDAVLSIKQFIENGAIPLEEYIPVSFQAAAYLISSAMFYGGSIKAGNITRKILDKKEELKKDEFLEECLNSDDFYNTYIEKKGRSK